MQINVGQPDVQRAWQVFALDGRPQQFLGCAQGVPFPEVAAAQERRVLVAAFALQVQDLQHTLHRSLLRVDLDVLPHRGIQRLQRLAVGRDLGQRRGLAKRAVAHSDTDVNLVLVMAVDGAPGNARVIGNIAHGGAGHAFGQEHALRGIEDAGAGALGLFFRLAGHAETSPKKDGLRVREPPFRVV
ncbi:hypothetical protein D9M68_668040 [compost metagenome]